MKMKLVCKETRGSERIETNCDPGSRVTPMNIASALALQSIAEVDHPLDIQSRRCLIYEGVSSPRAFARLFSTITKSYNNKLASLEATLVETTTESLTRVKCRATSVAKNITITVNIYLNSYIVD